MSKKNRGKIYKIGIIMFLMIILLYAMEKMRSDYDTYAAQNGVIERKISSKATVIRKEKIYFSENKGEVKFFFDEGDKVSAGALIAEQYIDADAKEIGESIEMINEVMQNKKRTSNSREKANEYSYSKIENDLQKFAYEKNGNAISDYISGTDSENYVYRIYEDYSYEELQRKKADLERSLYERKKSYYSSSAGLISYKYDGLEEVNDIEKINNFDINDASILDVEKVDLNKKYIEKNNPVIKVVDNYEWYLMCRIGYDESIQIEKNDEIKIRDTESAKTIAARVYRYERYGDEVLLILSLKDYLYDFLDKRYVDIEIIFDEYTGIIIKNTSLLKQDDKVGVYVCGGSGIVTFYPVDFYIRDTEESVIKEGYRLNSGDRGKIKLSEKNFNTVKVYDNIIEKPENVYEGQILR